MKSAALMRALSRSMAILVFALATFSFFFLAQNFEILRFDGFHEHLAHVWTANVDKAHARHLPVFPIVFPGP